MPGGAKSADFFSQLALKILLQPVQAATTEEKASPMNASTSEEATSSMEPEEDLSGSIGEVVSSLVEAFITHAYSKEEEVDKTSDDVEAGGVGVEHGERLSRQPSWEVVG